MADQNEDQMEMIAERILNQDQKHLLIKALLLSTSTQNGGGGFSNDILRLNQEAYAALEQLINPEVIRNTPLDGLRVTNWAEILSLTIAQEMSEYGLVYRVNQEVTEAERLAAAGEEDDLGFGAHNSADRIVIDSIYNFVGKERPVVANRGYLENIPLLVQLMCKKLLPGALFMKKRLEKLKEALDNVNTCVDRVRQLRNYPMRILDGTLRFEDGIKTCAKLEEGIDHWCVSLGDYWSMRPSTSELEGITPLIGDITEMQNDPKINTANTDWNESGGNKVRLLTRYNLRPVNGESNDAINQAKGELDRIMDKMVQYRRNRLEVAEEESDADDERPERVDDDGIIDPDVVNDHRHS